jgi:hypothetical protein
MEFTVGAEMTTPASAELCIKRFGSLAYIGPGWVGERRVTAEVLTTDPKSFICLPVCKC